MSHKYFEFCHFENVATQNAVVAQGGGRLYFVFFKSTP